MEANDSWTPEMAEKLADIKKDVKAAESTVLGMVEKLKKEEEKSPLANYRQ